MRDSHPELPRTGHDDGRRATVPRWQLPNWDNDKPNMILRQCYYVEWQWMLLLWGIERGSACCRMKNPLLFLFLLLCVCSDVNASRIVGGAGGYKISDSPRVTGLDADVAVAAAAAAAAVIV